MVEYDQIGNSKDIDIDKTIDPGQRKICHYR